MIIYQPSSLKGGDKMTNKFLIICGGSGYKLLGQRALLEFDAELQIDVRQQNVSRNWKKLDPRSLSIDLDQRVATTAVAFGSLLKKYGGIPKDKKNIKPDHFHAFLLSERFPANRDLEWGMNQSPAVGKAAIMHQYNHRALKNAIKDLVTSFGHAIGPNNPIEVWIVSSTAGGTGEGTHRYVAEVFTKFIDATFAETTIEFHFIRIGQHTYRSANNQITGLNSFFGIAADAAFMHALPKEYPLAVTSWIYFDIPDFGGGEKAKITRGDLIEIICKAVMSKDLQRDFRSLMAKNEGAPIVIVRAGLWGMDFDKDLMYYETLSQLISKLTSVLEPNYYKEFIENKSKPTFIYAESNEYLAPLHKTKYLINQIEEKGWKFPNYKSEDQPKTREDIVKLISKWKESINQVIRVDFDHLEIAYHIETGEQTTGGSKRRVEELKVPNFVESENSKWFQNIHDTHRVIAWARKLLGIVPRKDDDQSRKLRQNNQFSLKIINWMNKLFSQKPRTDEDLDLIEGYILETFLLAEQLSKYFHGFELLSSNATRRLKASKVLGKFAMRVIQVDYLLRLEINAIQSLDREQGEIHHLLVSARKELDNIKLIVGSHRPTTVHVAELSDILNNFSRKSWLQILIDAHNKGDLNQLERAVMLGATGFTFNGLKNILGLSHTDDVHDIQNSLGSKNGSIVNDKGEELEGIWWQAVPPTETSIYQFRLLPNMRRNSQELLSKTAKEHSVPFRYIFSNSGYLGLNVLAISAASLNQIFGDTVSTPVYLMKPFLEIVKNELDQLSSQSNISDSRALINILAASAIGDPLHVNALRACGLTDKEIGILARYFTFYGEVENKSDDLLKLLSEYKSSNSTSIDLENLNIVKFPTQILGRADTKSINLSNNYINNIPAEIAQLKQLTKLNLRDNQIKELPSEIQELKKLKLLDLRGNFLQIPFEIINKIHAPYEILNYHFRKKTSKNIGLPELKIILVGQGSVGKTSLCKRLISNTFDINERKTDGINIQTYLSQPDSFTPVRANIWDFGGQEIMHATHQFFLTKRSLYLLVLDARLGQSENRIEYWLRIIQSFGGDSPIIIVGNKTDQQKLDVDKRGLQNKFNNIKAFVQTSCLDGSGIDKLKKTINAEISALPHLQDKLPESWIHVKEKIEYIDKDCIPYSEYVSICNDYGIGDEISQSTLISFLHDLGSVINYREDPRLHDTNILNPEWVTNGVYSIMNSNILFQNKGVLEINNLRNILDRDNYPKSHYMIIVDMMQKFELCYPFEGNNEKYLVPDLLTHEEPYTGNWENALAFKFHYNVLPSSIISRFIVRMHHLISKKTYWRNGVVLEESGNRALVKADSEDRIIHIFVDGPINTRIHLLSAIRNEFNAIHKSISRLVAEEKVPVPGHKKAIVDYEHLILLERKGVSNFIPEGMEETILVQDLLNGVDPISQRLRNKGEAARKVERSKGMKTIPKDFNKEEPTQQKVSQHTKFLSPLFRLLIFIFVAIPNNIGKVILVVFSRKNEDKVVSTIIGYASIIVSALFILKIITLEMLISIWRFFFPE